MEFVKAMKIQRRMLGLYDGQYCNEQCCTCNYHKDQTKKDCACEEFPILYPQLAGKILEKWNAENPPKSRIEVFMEKFPYADKEKIINNICCGEIWDVGECPVKNDGWGDCKNCWNEASE